MQRLASIVFLPLGLETDTEWPGVWRTGAQVVLRYWSTEDKARMPKVQSGVGEMEKLETLL